MSDLQVGLVTGEYPPDQGGVGDFTREVARALVLQGNRVHVITTGSQGTDEGPDGTILVHRIVPQWDWRCWRHLCDLSEAIGLDVLNIQYQAAAYRMHPAINLFPWRTRRQTRPTVVTTFHDLRVPYVFPKAGPIRWQTVFGLARWSDGVIVTNLEDERQLAATPLLTPVRRIPIGSNIAPSLPDCFDRVGWRRRWGVGVGELLMGYFGFLNERKGGEDLIRVLAGTVNRGVSGHLLLIGGEVGTSDPTNRAYAERVDHLVEGLGLSDRVHRTGFVSAEEVSACLEAVDVCILPYREGASLRHGSLHACLAHGRPIVTTRPVLDVPEFRDGESMLLVRRGDVPALVDAAARVWSDENLRDRLGAGAVRLSTEFTWERIAYRTTDFFVELAP
ncbi:MAG: glycosyltransferase family 4 protein [Anaerolineae bacterium]|nr:glycosyltransferase family 4 protein [Anaerolineae bacterium]